MSNHTNTSQEQQAYDTYEEQLRIAPGKRVPDLISSMTSEQWLDAMSAPRIDPTNPGRRHMSMLNGDNEPTDSEDTEGETNEEDDDEDGSEWESDWETDDDEWEEEDQDDEEGAHSGDEGGKLGVNLT